MVTIDFFELDNREELLRERAEAICNLYFVLNSLGDDALREYAAQRVEILLSSASQHASCSRAFRIRDKHLNGGEFRRSVGRLSRGGSLHTRLGLQGTARFRHGTWTRALQTRRFCDATAG